MFLCFYSWTEFSFCLQNLLSKQPHEHFGTFQIKFVYFSSFIYNTLIDKVLKIIHKDIFNNKLQIFSTSCCGNYMFMNEQIGSIKIMYHYVPEKEDN